MILKLQRLVLLPDCALGVLSLDDIPYFYTVERPWLNNAPNISCIPAASYPVKWVITETSGNRNGRGLGVENVEHRSLIRIHVANTASEVQGCIGVGMERVDFPEGKGVGNSRRALRKLMDKFEGKEESILHVFNPT